MKTLSQPTKSRHRWSRTARGRGCTYQCLDRDGHVQPVVEDVPTSVSTEMATYSQWLRMYLPVSRQRWPCTASG
ncbi:hypothetical protein BgiBS90_031381 [Biomphalaria glabrata]|nr:hypothetical protein BgiBS90_031381 [Biomphalaria glabrata]